MNRLGENNLAMIAARVKADYIPKSDTVQAQPLSVDNTPTEGSDNLVTSGGVYDAVSDKEDTTNKVTSLSNANTDIQYPSAKAVYDSFYKRGVISQTQTWTQAQDGGYDYVMSNLVYGDIPKSNIDLYEAAGATFNATTGYFELNELTDISYKEMQDIYNYSQSVDQRNYSRQYCEAKVRTNIRPYWDFVGRTVSSGNSLNSTLITNAFSSSLLERFIIPYRPNDITEFTSPAGIMFDAKYIKKIINPMKIASGFASSAFLRAYSLEDIEINGLTTLLSFSYSPRLSVASILYMINNEAATSAITITLHATAYARAIADTDVQAALQNHPLVTLASA